MALLFGLNLLKVSLDTIILLTLQGCCYLWPFGTGFHNSLMPHFSVSVGIGNSFVYLFGGIRSFEKTEKTKMKIKY